MTSSETAFVKKYFAQLMKKKSFHFCNDKLNAVPKRHGVYVIFYRN
jgi:hypothetical protein